MRYPDIAQRTQARPAGGRRSARFGIIGDQNICLVMSLVIGKLKISLEGQQWTTDWVKEKESVLWTWYCLSCDKLMVITDQYVFYMEQRGQCLGGRVGYPGYLQCLTNVSLWVSSDGTHRNQPLGLIISCPWWGSMRSIYITGSRNTLAQIKPSAVIEQFLLI